MNIACFVAIRGCCCCQISLYGRIHLVSGTPLGVLPCCLSVLLVLCRELTLVSICRQSDLGILSCVSPGRDRIALPNRDSSLWGGVLGKAFYRNTPLHPLHQLFLISIALLGG